MNKENRHGQANRKSQNEQSETIKELHNLFHSFAQIYTIPTPGTNNKRNENE